MAIRVLAISVSLAVLGAFPPGSSANLQVFFTCSAQPYGLTDPALALQPTLAFEDVNTGTPGFEGHDSDSYQVAAFPPLAAWGQTPEIHAGEFAYIWIRFNNETNSRRILNLSIDLTGTPAEVAYYVVNDHAISDIHLRWGGSYDAPDADAFRQDPQILSSSTSYGIYNRAVTQVDAWNLYDAATRTALLGAVRFPPHSGDVTAACSVVFAPGVAGDCLAGTVRWAPEPLGVHTLLLLACCARRPRRIA